MMLATEKKLCHSGLALTQHSAFAARHPGFGVVAPGPTKPQQLITRRDRVQFHSPKMNLYITTVVLLSFSLHVSAYQPKDTRTTRSSRRPRISCIDRRSVLATPAAAATVAASPLILNPNSARAAAPPTGGPRVPLDGAKNGFPLASFGLQIYDDDTAYRLTLTALEVGYRNFFASVLAGNQKGFARAIKASGISRDEIYICGTVLSNRAKGESAAFFKTRQGCQENMNAMAYGGIDKLDQIMLDYPGPDAESVRGQWKAFEEMKREGMVDTLSVSNFNAKQLDAIVGMGPDVTKPAINQLPFSLAYHPSGLLDYNKERGVLVQSWSPLSRVLTNPSFRPVLASIGNNHGKSPAQVGLRWIVQNGAGFCTQSKSKKHFEEDLNVFDFELTADEMQQLTKLAG